MTSVAGTRGDVNYDGNVGFDDLLTLAQNYGKSLAAGQTAAPTPGV